MPKLELAKIAVTQLTRLLSQERRKGRHWSRAHKVTTCMYVCLCSTAPHWVCTTFLNRECLQAAWLPRGSLSWSCTSLLSLLSSDKKVAARSLGGETRTNRGAIDGCRLQVRSKAYSAYSYKRGTCVGFWRDCAAIVCLASVNWCIFHVKQLPSTRRPNKAWSGSEFEESMPSTDYITQFTATNVHMRSRTSDLGYRSWCNHLDFTFLCTATYPPLPTPQPFHL